MTLLNPNRSLEQAEHAELLTCQHVTLETQRNCFGTLEHWNKLELNGTYYDIVFFVKNVCIRVLYIGSACSACSMATCVQNRCRRPFF